MEYPYIADYTHQEIQAGCDEERVKDKSQIGDCEGDSIELLRVCLPGEVPEHERKVDKVNGVDESSTDGKDTKLQE